MKFGAITPIPSQNLKVQYRDKAFHIDLDSGATVSFITKTMADKLQIPILPNNQLALLADKIHRMKSLGEIDILFVEQETGHVILRLRAASISSRLVFQGMEGKTFLSQTRFLVSWRT